MDHYQYTRTDEPLRAARKWMSFVVLLRIGFSLLPSLSIKPFRDFFCQKREAYVSRRLDVCHYGAPLPPNHIRLLRIQGWALGLLYCSLESVALDTCSKYTALSYTWASEDRKLSNFFHFRTSSSQKFDTDGTQVSGRDSMQSPSSLYATRLIVCDGRALQITPNLYEALRSIPVSREHNQDLWWIDQVCINQFSEDDKSLQVPLMGSIYRKASTVAVWLGHGYSWEIQALAFIPELFAGPPKRSVYRWVWNSAGACLYFALANIVRRSWFHRVWIVQELMLAKNAVFFLSDYSTQYEALYECISRIAQNVSGLGFGRTSTDVFQESFQLLESCKHFKDGGEWTIEEWVSTIRGHRASDPRDHIYAGLSLLSESDRSVIRVDYHESRKKVFRDVTKYLFDKSGIDALTLAERGSETAPLSDRATWEVNADSPTLRTPLLKLHQSHFNACPPSITAWFNLENEPDLLQAKALLVDEIDIVCSESLLRTGDGIADLLQMILRIDKKYFWTGEDPLLTVARSLTASAVLTPGSPFTDVTARQDMVSLIATIAWHWKQKQRSRINPLDTLKNNWPHYKKYNWNRSNTDYVEQYGSQIRVPVSMVLPSSEASHHMLAATRQRCLFMTKKGMIGLGPTSTKQRQMVAIIAGARVPYILNSVPLHLIEEELEGWDKALIQRVQHIAMSRPTLKLACTRSVQFNAARETTDENPRISESDLELETIHPDRNEAMSGEGVSEEERRKLDIIRSSMQLVGEAYLHGFMHGEVQHWMQREALSWQDIHIQ